VTAELPTTGDEVAAFDLVSCLGRLADRRAGRTEADIQADVRDVLLYGGLNISSFSKRRSALNAGSTSKWASRSSRSRRTCGTTESESRQSNS
jgi:hypothetical protein